jgi:hypothetical protein
MKDIQRGIVGGNAAPATTQQSGRKSDHLRIVSFSSRLF